MASASKNLYCSNRPSSYPYVLAVSFSESNPSIPNNTSVINITGSLSSSSGANWESSYNSTLAIYWFDNHTGKETFVKSITFSSIALSSSKTVSGSITVTHKPDGSLHGYARAYFTAGSSSGGWCPASNNVYTADTTLTKIARASSVSFATCTELGSAVTVNISRAVTNFTHKVEYKVGNSTWTQVGTGIATSSTFTPPVTLASQYPDTVTAVVYVRVTTFNGSNQIGSAVTASKNIKIPESVIPSFTSLSVTRNDNGIPAAWGLYVKGYSKATVAINGAQGIHGSSIKSYSITGGGLNSSSASATTGPLQTVGNVTFTGTITDSRGRKATRTATINVVDYFLPSISVTSQRCSSNGTPDVSGTYLKVTCTYKYATVNNKNTVTKSVTCNGASNTTFTSGVAFILAANCSVGKTYIPTATIKDSLGNSATTTDDVPTGERVINIKKNKKAIAFGEFATEDNTVKSKWPFYGPDFIGDKINSLPSLDYQVYRKNLTTENLNDVVVNGTYIQHLNANVTVARNYPMESVAGKLEVVNGNGGQIYQTYHTYTNNEYFYRCYYSNTWREWKRLDYYNTQKVLWSGGAFMHATQTIALSEGINEQRNGIVLVWCGYENGVVQNSSYNYFFVPKYKYTNDTVSFGTSCFLSAGDSRFPVGFKYVYILNKQIKGYTYNDSAASENAITSIKGTNNRFVLCNVIGV